MTEHFRTVCFALLLCCLQPLPLGIHTSTTLCTYYRTSRDVVYVGFTWSNRESCAPLQQKNYPSSFEEAKALTTYPQQSKNNIKTKIEEKLRNKNCSVKTFFCAFTDWQHLLFKRYQRQMWLLAVHDNGKKWIFLSIFWWCFLMEIL